MGRSKKYSKKGKRYSIRGNYYDKPQGKDHEVVSEKVIIYKNGHAVVINSIKLPANQSEVYVEIPGSCIFGTLFVKGEGQKIKNYTVVKNMETDGEKLAVNYKELVGLNVGRTIKLSYSKKAGGGTKIIEEIVEVLSYTSSMVMVKSESGMHTIAIENIIEVSSATPDDELIYYSETETEFDRLKIEYEPSEEEGTAIMQYMTGNILWVPAYKLHLQQDGQASIHLQVCLCNDSESLVARKLICALNAPQMNYLNDAEVLLDQSRSVQSLLDRLKLTGRASNKLSVSGSQGKNLKDVLQYNLSNIELPLNSKRTVPVFTETVSYDKVFDCHINDKRKFQEVFESVRLVNTSHRPFTDGSVFISSDQSEFVSHNTLPFVGPKGDALIRTCEAHGVLVSCTKELEKKEQVVKDGTNYEVRTFYSKIKAKNGRQSTISALINYDFNGIYNEEDNPNESKPKIEVVPDLYHVFSPSNYCEWSFDILPDEETNIAIRFVYYHKIKKPKKKGRRRQHYYGEYYGEDEDEEEEEEDEEPIYAF